MLTAGEFCNRDVVFATAEESVVEIAKRMRELHVGSVIVVEERGAGRVPIGVLTDRDIVVGLVALAPSYVERATVRDVLVEKLITAQESENVYDVMALMRSHGVRRLPIVNAQHVLQGIIAFDDLVAHVAEELGTLASLLRREQERERRQRP